MNKTLLRQALKFKEHSPTFSETKQLNEAIKKYEEENSIRFTNIRYGKRSEILDFEEFFEFLSEVANDTKPIRSFEDIERILSGANSRANLIENSGDSKSRYIKVFDKVVIFKSINQEPKIYKDIDKIKPLNLPIVAVENGESFLEIDNFLSRFGYKQAVYLGGMSNSATRRFLEDKDVIFFLDYDIEAIRIYDSFKCKSKRFFKYPDIEEIFANKRYQNIELYKRQLYNLPKEHNELNWLIKLIKKYSAVIEQEVLR